MRSCRLLRGYTYVDRRGKDHILAHTDPKHDMPEDADTPTDA